MAKRVFCVFLSIFLMVALVACGGGSGDSNRNTATGTKEKAVGTARSNPAPIGTPVKVVFKEDKAFDEPGYVIEMTLLEALRGDAAAKKLRETGNQFLNESAAEIVSGDSDLLLCRVKVKCLEATDEDEAFYMNSAGISAYSTSGTQYTTVALVDLGEDFSDIFVGAETTGWVAFPVDKSDEEPLLEYAYFAENDAWFKTK